MSGDALVDFVNQLVDKAGARSQTQHERSLGGLGTLLRLGAAVFFEEGCGSSQVAGTIDCVTDAANFFGRADLHGAFRHMHRRPEFILVAVGIGEIDDGAFVAVGGRLYRVRMRDLVLIEPAQV
jgi:hypothetical protein